VGQLGQAEPAEPGPRSERASAGSAKHVDELRRAEQRTRDLSEQLRAAVEAGGLGTWRWDLRTGVTVWDERLEALFGLPPGGFAGSFDAYVAMIDPDERDAVLATVQHAVEDRATYRVEHKVVWPDGSIHWIAAVGGVTLDDEGNVTGTVGCCMDITARIVQEQEHQHLAGLAVDAAARERLLRQRLQFLSDINDALLAASTLPELMANVTATAVPRLGDWCSIHVLPFEGGTVPHVEVAHVDPAMVAYAGELQQRFPFDPHATAGVAQVIRTGATAFHPDVADMVEQLDLGADLRHVITRLALRSYMAVPLAKRGRILGALQFVMSTSGRRYTSDDVTLAHTVADRIASSIENLRLYEQQRLIARTLQRSLLPAALPSIPAVEIAVRYWPAGEANEVGGDFYDVFPLGSADHWAIVVGDVCGTGPAAAALTGLARHTIRASAWHDDSPVGVLGALDRAVRNSATGSFLTAVYASLDTSGDRPELTVTSGGHPLPVHVRGGGATMDELGEPGTLLGMVDEVRFVPRTTSLAPGDVVVFFTDGATDVAPPHDLDGAGFGQLVQRAVDPDATVEVIADRIRDALEAVLTFRRRNDDIALLVLKVVGPSSPAGGSTRPGG
jgi:PAS domain S-box-containing protein